MQEIWGSGVDSFTVCCCTNDYDPNAIVNDVLLPFDKLQASEV
jgi:hypothetical protein